MRRCCYCHEPVREGGLVMAALCIIGWVAFAVAALYGAYGR